MPVYEYICNNCRTVTELFFQLDDDSRPARMTCSCGGQRRRKFSFSAPEQFEPHYNYSVGAHVTSKADLKEKLRVASAQATERTGIPHDFSMIDRAEVSDADVGVDEAGMRETHDRQVQLGMKEATGKTVL